MQQPDLESVPVSEAPSSDESDYEEEVDNSADILVTVNWAQEVLTLAGVVDAEDVQVGTRDGVTGSLSKVLSVNIRYVIDNERKTMPLVLKLPPRDPFGRLFVAEAQFDTREVLFYTELAPVLNKLAEEAFGQGEGLHIPKCIKATLPRRIGEDSELVLEDVTAEGFVSANFADGLNERRAKAALSTAARLHALSLALREKHGALDEVFDFLFPCERAAAGYLRLIRRGLPQLEEFLRGRSDCIEEAAAVSALCARAPALLDTLLRPVEPAPIVHADFWSGNLLFREREGIIECKVLDWQMISLGRPMDDIALLLLSSLCPELRRSIGDSLIEYYGDCLTAECEKLGTFAYEEVRRGLRPDWPRAALRALLLCAGSVDVALGDPRAEARLLEAVRDLHTEGVLDLKPVDADA